MNVGNSIRNLRGDVSQLKLSMELNVSRESISAYETERAKLPKDISVKIMEKYDDPFFAMTVASDYTGAWVRKLDGPNVDLHRSSVKEKSTEELHELLQAFEHVSLTIPPSALNDHKRKEIEESLLQSIDVIVALSHYVAVLSEDYDFSWKGLWDKHLAKLIAKGYVKK